MPTLSQSLRIDVKDLIQINSDLDFFDIRNADKNSLKESIKNFILVPLNLKEDLQAVENYFKYNPVHDAKIDNIQKQAFNLINETIQLIEQKCDIKIEENNQNDSKINQEIMSKLEEILLYSMALVNTLEKYQIQKETIEDKIDNIKNACNQINEDKFNLKKELKENEAHVYTWAMENLENTISKKCTIGSVADKAKIIKNEIDRLAKSGTDKKILTKIAIDAVDLIRNPTQEKCNEFKAFSNSVPGKASAFQALRGYMQDFADTIANAAKTGLMKVGLLAPSKHSALTFFSNKQASMAHAMKDLAESVRPSIS